MHNHSVQLINGKSYNFTNDQAINLDQHITNMIINLQMSIASTFFASNGNFVTFKIQADQHSVHRSFLEFNVTTMAHQLSLLCPAHSWLILSGIGPAWVQ
jgi:hypothetical protein